MSKDTTPQTEDITKAWEATQDQKGKAKKFRLLAAGSWVVAIGTQIVAITMLLKDTFNEGNMALLIGFFVVIAIFALIGNILWKKSNRQDPATRAEPAKFFIQNQLGAIITVLAFLPLLALVFLDKDMDPKTKKMAGGVGAALAALVFASGVELNPASTEQYTQDMNACAAQIKSGEPTTACSPEVAAQAQDIADDSAAVAEATKSEANPNGLDTVYWIAPKAGKERSSSPLVFHLCEDVSTLRGKNVNSGTVTEAYAQNAVRLTKQLTMEQRQCGFATAE